MRLLHCIHSINPAGGGPAEFVRQSACLQARHNFSLEVACLDSPTAPWLSNFSAPVHALGSGFGRYGLNTSFVKWVKQNRDRFDIVIVNGIWQFHSFGTWLALRGGKIPYVVFPHGMLDPWFNENYLLKHWKKQIYWLACEYHVLANANAVLFTCEQERLRAATSFVPYKAIEAVTPYGTIAPGCDLKAQGAEFLLRWPQLANRYLFVYLGRIHPKKGCDLLIEAVKKISKENPIVHLVLAGPCDKPYERQLHKLLSGAECVTRIPMITGNEKWGLLSKAEALILPSHQENFARVVSEALSCATPVLLSDKVNIWSDVVADGAGLAAPDTIAGTEQLLCSFLVLSHQEKHAMAERALACFQKRFNLSTNFRAYLNLLVQSVQSDSAAAQ